MVAGAARLRFFYSLCFASGAAALGYQMVWTRLVTAALGHEIPAILAIVSAFLGGMALGAWTLDRPISHSANPWKWFASLELVIGTWGVLSTLVIPWGSEIASRLIGLETNAGYWIIAFGFSFLLLLPATFAMGATFPAFERTVTRIGGQSRSVGAVYAANTLGAVFGIMITVFFLAPTYGFRITTCILGSINIVSGLIALGLGRAISDKPSVAPPNEEASRETATDFDAAAPMSKVRLWASVFVTGLLAIAFEALAVRVLSQILENTIYSFASALATYLLATSLGALAFQRWGVRRMGRSLLIAQVIGCSCACLLAIMVLGQARGIYDWGRQVLGSGMWSVISAEAIVAGAVFALPTFVMGTLFSHLLQWARRPSGGLGRAAALNTLGGCAGALVFGVAVLPLLGTKWSLAAVALLYTSLIPRWSKREWPWVALPLLLVLLLPSTLQIVDLPPNGHLLRYREGTMASVAVVSDSAGERTLRVNNRFQMGGTAAAAAEYRHAHIPLLLHADPRQALFLGLGTGITLGAARFYPDLRADGVELIREVIEVMPFFAPANHSPHNSPRIRIHNADARRFVRLAATQYDVIVADLFHPARDGAGTLYTREHFSAIQRRLNPGGIFCQWLPLHQLDGPTLRTIVRTFLEVFPQARVCWLQFNVDIPVIGLIATTNMPAVASDWMEQRHVPSALQAVLKKIGLTDSLRFFGHFIAGPGELAELSRNGQLNTDDRPEVMFSAPQVTAHQQSAAADTLRMVMALTPTRANGVLVIDETSAEGWTTRLEDYWKARDIFLGGLIKEANNQRAAAIDDYVRSAQVSADFTSGYAQCLTIAAVLARSRPTEARQLLERLVVVRPERPVAKEMLKRLSLPATR